MKKRIKYLGVLLMAVFFNVFCVKAVSLPQSLGPISQVGNAVTITGANGITYGMTLKVSISDPVICTEFGEESPALIGATCTINSDWDEKIRYAVAAVIIESKSKVNNTSVTDDYFAANLAVNKFLWEKEAGGYNVNEATLSGNFETLYLQYKGIANAAYAGYDSASNINIQTSETELTFTLIGENYESNIINVSGVDSYTVTSNVGTVYELENGFKIIVPVKDLDETTEVTANITSTKNIEQARNYECGEGYQTITPYDVEIIKIPDEISLTGIITPISKVIISKLDATGKEELPGATLEIQDEEGNIVRFCTDVEGNKNTECKWVSTDEPYVIEGLPSGKYYLIETIAPKGYALNEEKILFEVKDDVIVTKVAMENQLEVEVPNTLSARSTLLLTIAMLDIAFGIGIIVYVKKNKIKE